MALKVCVLASGSSGNCTYIGDESCAILIDAGIAARTVRSRLAAIGAEASKILGICVSHEHTDHTSGLPSLHRQFRVPVYANSATVEALSQNEELAEIKWHVFLTGSRFQIGPFSIEPFSVPHDALDPVGFVVSYQQIRIGLATDVGMVTQLLRERFRFCRALVIEANHDERLLENSNRPWYLKQRIRGRQGHLSNRTLAEALADFAGPELEQVFLAHLSQECNREELALKAAKEALKRAGRESVRVVATYPDRPSEIWEA